MVNGSCNFTEQPWVRDLLHIMQTPFQLVGHCYPNQKVEGSIPDGGGILFSYIS